jgi:hypothetical protein
MVATVCFAVAALFAGLAGECIYDMIVSEAARSLGHASFLAVCILFTIAPCGLGLYFMFHTNSEVADILGDAPSAE